ncbi:MAG: DUF4124 domain-containing protein [Gallionella sp.]|nr:DUF4124 domain-containing protein [Gallionella sp.]
MLKPSLLIALVIGATLSLPAAAKMYKWVDDKGVTHYGETIPPEYANKDRVEMEKGRVTKKVEIMSREDYQAKKEADEKKREVDKVTRDKKLRDTTLINTYSNSGEVDLARKRSLQQVEARITSNQSQLKMATTSLVGLQQEAEKRAQAKQPVSESLQEELSQSQSHVARLQKNLDASLAEKATVEAKFDADKARYIELTGK